MRSIWNGAISFGLVSIPIKLVNATENHSISFRQIHLADGGRIRYRKVCEIDEQEVSAGEIGKAYEEADGSMIPITDEDLGSLPLPTAKTIEIVAFVPAASIDPLQMDAAYYLSANGVPAAKPYTLLREALKRSQKVALAKYALRGRERLGMLRVVDDVIAMHGLLWPDEIRSPEGVAPETEVTVRDAELDLADALMDTLGEVDMDSLHDDYREAVEEPHRREGGRPDPGARRGGRLRWQGHRPDRGPGEQRPGGEGGSRRGAGGRGGGGRAGRRGHLPQRPQEVRRHRGEEEGHRGHQEEGRREEARVRPGARQEDRRAVDEEVGRPDWRRDGGEEDHREGGPEAGGEEGGPRKRASA